jgi:hypothetical protein
MERGPEEVVVEQDKTQGKKDKIRTKAGPVPRSSKIEQSGLVNHNI